ncbi:water stress/hypersensitive response domain-containing protein [Pseudomonas sp. Choline-3u-10]|mgnify:FL=1|jgi:LEA14-like dessication related protein|uniref:LEA type 2 family protein n=1 Tax=Pseudomonadaceae TaxID=135621 RepID=UPI000617E04E|nr:MULTISPECIES: LEA type 2 family protein [Pseudomonadaceae]AZZ46976.1 water stress/hypersensitive response domain-containing protein [Pseudomonadaceae bacterium SI-3]MAL35562.1 water stress/hypersensitive response domain-containing protein [Pseudomonas sp.]MBU0949555.1 LEA type 2 family protein [Gammaproteobacteria bacterium]KJJ64687.1 water stress/hypersensitive response domain-containing protein [Pseudomonas sp. 10B238]MBK3793792.1 water stress/hypersensitive response domain-containing pro|tara:strand:- start:214 stop:714 length:501 start_codon:yes stop_codon:yes gene_type:complete
MPLRSAVPVVRLLSVCLLALTLTACAAFFDHDPLNVQVAGIQPLPGEGLELRMAVKLRVQNPNDRPLDYDGVALELEINGRNLASGVSDASGTIPRFGETVLSVPMTISAFSAARQALGLAEHIGMDEVPYVLRGKLAGGRTFGTQRFIEKGTLNLEGALPSPYRR